MDNMTDLLPPQKTKDSLSSGVYVGKVTSNKDEKGRGRVKIILPWRGEEDEYWARIAVPMAGNGRGMVFYPEVEDEVLVAFEHGDINHPYVIGALWNGKDLPPETNSDGKNNIRKIKSRSGHELIFNDEEKKEKACIHTKAGHKIVLNDTSDEEKLEIWDKSGNNSIVIDSVENSITISGQKKIDTKSGNNSIVINSEENSIVISSQMKIEIKSGNNSITIDSAANSITISSQAQLSIKSQIVNLEAQGTMTIKSSGILTLQGSLVKIN
jgi:uncharacterized protein involved in type VI secretion and phage assembly